MFAWQGKVYLKWQVGGIKLLKLEAEILAAPSLAAQFFRSPPLPPPPLEVEKISEHPSSFNSFTPLEKDR